MKLFIFAFIFVAMWIDSAVAGVATQQTTKDYQRLLNNSPFTLKPVAENNVAQEQPSELLEDWLLAGILPLENSYFVTLRHKKEAGRSEMMSGVGAKSVGGFELIKVEAAATPANSRVQVRYGGKTEWLGFDLQQLGVPDPKPVAQIQNSNKPGGDAAKQADGKNNNAPEPVRQPQSRLTQGNRQNTQAQQNQRGGNRGGAQQNQRGGRERRGR